MNNLLDNHKKWLTLDEAVNRISNSLDEPFTIADIYKFALDGHLILSVYFASFIKAKKVTIIKKEDIKYRKVLPKNIPSMPQGAYLDVPINAEYPISRGYWVESVEDKVESLSGVWDLSMIGTEIFSIKQLYLQAISSDIQVKVPEGMGVYIKDAEKSYQLQLLLTMDQYRERHRYRTDNELKPRILESALAYPASRMDDLDYVLILRLKEVARFIEVLGGTKQEVRQSSQKVYTRNNDKQIANKAKTQAKYSSWQREAIKLQKMHPNKSKTWIAMKISKSPISEGKSADTIRKNIKI